MAKIFIVDDEENIRLFYSEELKDEGYDVATAAEGYNLVERIREEKPDVVILDIKLAGHNGLDLLQEVRKEFYDLPVILCSAYSSFKGEMRTYSADTYVVKSSDLTELKKEIRKALEKEIPSPSEV